MSIQPNPPLDLALESARVREHFTPEPGSVYLNSATYGLPPRRTVEALERALDQWRTGNGNWIEDWDLAGEQCRRLVADLLKASRDEVALMPAVSVASAIVASAVPQGGEVLVAENDFTSVIYPFLEAARLGRFTVREAPLAQLSAAIGPNTSMVAVSHVQSADGAKVEVGPLRQAADAVGAKIYLDLSQSLGVVPFDVDAEGGVDYVACGAYKWMCCPRGVAFLYVRRQSWPHTSAVTASWRGGDDPYGRFYGSPLRLSPTASRFDVSLAWHAWVGAQASLEFLTELGDARRFALANAAARRFADLLELPPPSGGIVSLAVRDGDGAAAALESAKVRTSIRAGKIRASFHFYNTEDEAERVAELLRPFL